ncbi:colicin V synthesis protein [Hydrogenophaga crassostreae]|uniref:Colicin V synthesis protein n=1 Tax=Hydrogenophaga crassostreae TaxID=1763535 RepID=A0A167IAQ1_9BURK|nr:CvpA family protein [Hydrogenophaga crassostreae]AOW12385.1 colicin V synthesis protein [Hydrogenophaga crassostreae]OAD42436.1 colicin V synthesis protein [Hydrogenophaga crassostreae]
MSWVDVALLAVLGISILLGLWRGLVYEVLSVAGWVIAFFAAQRYAGAVAEVLPMDQFAPALRLAAGFALVFIATAFACGIVSWLVKKMVASVGLRPVDRILGGVFGIARGLLILLGLTVVVSMTPLHAEPAWQSSPVAAGLAHGLEAIKPVLPAAMGQYLP